MNDFPSIKFSEKHHDEIAKLFDYELNSEEKDDILKAFKKSLVDNEPPRFLYILRHGESDYYKIGISNKVDKRIDTLQTGNPVELKFIACYESDFSDFLGREITYLENFLHKNFADKRVRGEWFEFDYSTIADICMFLDSRDIDFCGSREIIELQEYDRRCKIYEKEE